ncbi:hypothetical protein E4U56_002052, partial [Claviceps arundinis]
LDKQRRDAGYQFTRCKGRHIRSLGLPCWHRLAEVLRTSGVPQASDYHVYWWVDRSQTAEVEVERPNIPLEPQIIETSRRQQRARPHQRGAGPRGSRREPSLFDRLDSNNRAATPPSTLPSRMARVAVPPEQVFVWRVPPPAVTASTTTTAPSQPFLPMHAQQQQLALGPPQQRQLPAFTGPHSRQQAPLHNLQSHHQPHAPWSIDNRAHEQYHGGQGSVSNWPSNQPQAQPLTTAASISGPQLGAPGMPIDIDADRSFRFPINTPEKT